jgi:gas vesicle protein
MKAATLSDLKKELSSQSHEQLLELCLRLGRFKKENKELLTYILFDSKSEEDYIKDIKAEMDLLFEEINSANLYWAKKSLRKILRNINKYSRYSNEATTSIELLISYCMKLKTSGIEFEKSTALKNLYESQIKKIKKEISTMHEDLQYDYKKKLFLLEN